MTLKHSCGHGIQAFRVKTIFCTDKTLNLDIAKKFLAEIPCWTCLNSLYLTEKFLLNRDEYENEVETAIVSLTEKNMLSYYGGENPQRYLFGLPPFINGSHKQYAWAHTIRHLFVSGGLDCDQMENHPRYWIDLHDMRVSEIAAKASEEAGVLAAFEAKAERENNFTISKPKENINNYNQTLELITGAKEYKEVVTHSVIITPEIAIGLLKSNTHNRKISNDLVQQYANEMRRNRWYMTGSGLSFDINGVLLDGQHRLMAVVESGESVPFQVTTGLDPDSQDKLDRNKKRTMLDVCQLKNLERSNLALKVCYFFILKNHAYGYKRRSDVPDELLEQYISKYGRSIGAIEKIISEKRSGKTFKRVGFVSAIMIYYEYDKDHALSFLSGVIKGEMLKEHYPEYLLRRYLKGEIKQETNKPTHIVDYEKTCYAIIKYHSGEHIKRLKLSESMKPIKTMKFIERVE